METVSAKQIQDEIYSLAINVNDNYLPLYEKIGMEIKVSEIENSIICPHLKKVLFKDIKAVCKKYNLVIAPIDRFIGQIPKNNLNDVVNFIDNYQRFCYRTYDIFQNEEIHSFYDKITAEKERKKFHWFKYKDDEVKQIYSLFICAPKEQLVIYEGEKIKGNKIIPDDPIIFAINTYYRYDTDPRNKDISIIITAWGEESSDLTIFNEKLN